VKYADPVACVSRRISLAIDRTDRAQNALNLTNDYGLLFTRRCNLGIEGNYAGDRVRDALQCPPHLGGAGCGLAHLIMTDPQCLDRFADSEVQSRDHRLDLGGGLLRPFANSRCSNVDMPPPW